MEFSDDELKKLYECFCQLDEDSSGAIGIEELLGPLIGLGFAESTEEVRAMVDAVDDNGTGSIEFKEFLRIIKNASHSHHD